VVFVLVLDGYRYFFFVVKEVHPEKECPQWCGNVGIDQLLENEKEVDRKIMSSMTCQSETLGLNGSEGVAVAAAG